MLLRAAANHALGARTCHRLVQWARLDGLPARGLLPAVRAGCIIGGGRKILHRLATNDKPKPTPRRAVATSRSRALAQPMSSPTPPVAAFALRALADQGPDASLDAQAADHAEVASSTTTTHTTIVDEPAEQELASASMSVFARMEASMRAKKKHAEITTATSAPGSAIPSEPSAPPTSSSSGSSMSWATNMPRGRPSEPTVGMCCGRDCANCVWIQYSAQLADWEAEQDAEARHVHRDLAAKRDAISSSQQIQSTSSPDASAAAVSGSALALPAVSSPVRELSRFERAMQSEREMLSRVLPSGKGHKRALGAMLLPKNHPAPTLAPTQSSPPPPTRKDQ